MKEKASKEVKRIIVMIAASLILAVDTQTFVRTGGLIPGGAEGLREHFGYRALAVGAGDMDKAQLILRSAQQLKQPPYTRKVGHGLPEARKR